MVSILKNSIILKILICFTEHLLSDSFLLFYLQELTACKTNSLLGGIFWSDSQQSPLPGCVLIYLLLLSMRRPDAHLPSFVIG